MVDYETTSDVYCERHKCYLIEMVKDSKYDGEYCPEFDRESKAEHKGGTINE